MPKLEVGEVLPNHTSVGVNKSFAEVALPQVDDPLPKIVQDGADDGAVLRKVASDIPKEMFGTPELRKLADQMVEVMREAPGLGLAAPQIGVSLKILVAEDKEEYYQKQHVTPELQKKLGRYPFGPMVVCNPRLSAVGQEGYRYWEGCLSVEGYQAMVDRYWTIIVNGVDVEGKPMEFQVDGMKSRILQHEVDHLNGVIYTDRIIKSTFMPRKPPAEAEIGLDVKTGPCVCTHELE